MAHIDYQRIWLTYMYMDYFEHTMCNVERGYRTLLDKISSFDSSGGTNIMSSLISSFRDSAFHPLGDAGLDLAEVGLDAILEDGVLKDVPIFGTVAALCKTGINLRERNLMKQTATFIRKLNDGSIAQESLEHHRQGLEHDPHKAERELGRIMLLLDSQIEDLQAKMLAAFYQSYLQEAIKWGKFCELAEANRRMFRADYMILYMQYSRTKNRGESGGIESLKEYYQLDRLISLGLLRKVNSTKKVAATLSGSITIPADSKADVILTAFGRTFCQLGFKAPNSLNKVVPIL